MGGSGDDAGSAVAVDASDNTYVTGFTNSTNFPLKDPIQPTFRGPNFGQAEIFVTKLNAAGNDLIYSTYLGGSGGEGGIGIAVDCSRNAYVTGLTGSTDFPVTAGAFQTTYGGGDADVFVTKISPAGNALVYSTYLGGSDYDAEGRVAVDCSGNAYVTGLTRSTNFPVTTGAFQTIFGGGAEDAFVTKLNPGGNVIYSTYLGGSGFDDGTGIAVDAAGNAYVTGITGSTNFPVTTGAFQTTYGGTEDGFVAKLDATGSALIYSTYLGGSSFDGAVGIAVDASGNAYVTGHTASINFPLKNPIQATFGGRGNVYGDAFVTMLNAAGNDLIYSTYLGGSDNDRGTDIALDSSGNAYVTGITRSTNFPVANALFSTYRGGIDDAFVAKIVCSPTVGALSAPVVPVQVNTLITTSAAFTDPGMLDTHTAVWDWGDNTTSAGTVTETNGSGSVTGSHVYTAAGVYTVTLTVTDNIGCPGESVFQFVVVYDPSAGFVTGGGWIDSPAGAYAADVSLTGKANFGFVSKYQKGAKIPTDVTEFQFKLADLNFHSDNYEWLVVGGARAQYKGTGTINGAGNYGFLLTAIDGQIQGGGGVDKFRIKIWDSAEVVIYDNQMGAGDDANPTTQLGGGSIVIHTQ